MEGLLAYGESDSESEQPSTSVTEPKQSTPALSTSASIAAGAPQSSSKLKPTVELPSAASLLGGASSSGLGLSSLTGAKRRHSQVTKAMTSGSQSKVTRPPAGSGTAFQRQRSTAQMLLPPQLRGRSNVVTEDLDRLFTKRKEANTTPDKGRFESAGT